MLPLALTLSLLIALLGYWRGSLAPSGVVGAVVVGTLTLGLGGWVWGAMLFAFFLTSSALSHFRAGQKSVAAEKFAKGHRRDLGQALANGGVGALVALLAWWQPGRFWFPFFLGIMATVTADTWATEIGTLSRGLPRLVTNGRPAPVGTSGAISPLGTAVSAGGGLFIGLIAAFHPALGTLPALFIGAGAGLAGSLFDSLLGATVQRIYYCDICGKETEQAVHRGEHETRVLRGWGWLSNDVVNLVASLVGGITAVVLFNI